MANSTLERVQRLAGDTREDCLILANEIRNVWIDNAQSAGECIGETLEALEWLETHISERFDADE